MTRRNVLTMLYVGIAMSGSCGSGATEVSAGPPDPEVIHAPAAIVFTNVRVVPMTSELRLDDQTVVIRDGRIESIEPSGSNSPLPVDATVIDGRGRVLAPALIDMHVHLLRADLPAYLKAGIATVRNMWGHSAVAAIKHDIESGATLGPTVHSVSNGLDGSPPRWPATRLVNDPRDAETAVEEMVAAGWPALKVYQQLSAESYDSIVAAAKRRHMDFMGHVPTAVPVLHALESGQRSIEHLSGYDRAVTRRQGTGTFAWADVDASRFGELVRRTVETGTWNCPTMAIFLELSRNHTASDRSAIIANRRRFVAELQRAGARLLAGTDAGIDVVSPGSSMHDELRELVAAGLTSYQALRAATKDAGEFLRVPGLGTVTVGAPAELVLLDGDPLASIDNTRRIAGLTVRGSWYSAPALAALVSR